MDPQIPFDITNKKIDGFKSPTGSKKKKILWGEENNQNSFKTPDKKKVSTITNTPPQVTDGVIHSNAYWNISPETQKALSNKQPTNFCIVYRKAHDTGEKENYYGSSGGRTKRITSFVTAETMVLKRNEQHHVLAKGFSTIEVISMTTNPDFMLITEEISARCGSVRTLIKKTALKILEKFDITQESETKQYQAAFKIACILRKFSGYGNSEDNNSDIFQSLQQDDLDKKITIDELIPFITGTSKTSIDETIDDLQKVIKCRTLDKDLKTILEQAWKDRNEVKFSANKKHPVAADNPNIEAYIKAALERTDILKTLIDSIVDPEYIAYKVAEKKNFKAIEFKPSKDLEEFCGNKLPMQSRSPKNRNAELEEKSSPSKKKLDFQRNLFEEFNAVQ